MLRYTVFFIMLSHVVMAQSKETRIEEFTGTVKSILPFIAFSYQRINMEIGKEKRFFLFNPEYGEFITRHIKNGDVITFKAKVFVWDKEDKHPWKYMIEENGLYADHMVSIKVGNQWVDMPQMEISMRSSNSKAFFEHRVKDEYLFDGGTIYYTGKQRRALIFENGVVALDYSAAPLYGDIRKGDIVSFRGYSYPTGKGYVYPIQNVKEVYYFIWLSKAEGELKSWIYRDDFACIGMMFKTKDKELQMGFASYEAEKIKEFMGKHRNVMVYYCNYLGQLKDFPKPIDVIIADGDTTEYYSTRVQYSYKKATVKGRITHVNRKDSDNSIISIIVENKFYMEIDQAIQRQLENFLTKGQALEIEGEERLKLQGEIYRKSYTFIIPRKIIIGNKTFLINQENK
jgi:hypothetical protein